MNTIRRISPKCPKCQKQHTYDVISGMPSDFPLNDSYLEKCHKFSVGNATYHCIDCGYNWKKYRGKKPYDRMKIIYAEAGGFPGPFFNIKLDLESGVAENFSQVEMDSEDPPTIHSLAKEDIEWFRSELHTCDFVNWAEEYYDLDVLDGTHWSIRIEYDTHCEIKTGSNHFPPKWTKFCKAVSKLSGSEFY